MGRTMPSLRIRPPARAVILFALILTIIAAGIELFGPSKRYYGAAVAGWPAGLIETSGFAIPPAR